MLINKSFYFVRHGQTDYNLKKLCAGGKTNCPLNQNGILEAQDLKTKIASLSFEKVICSPMKRAIQTANIITSLNLILEEDLREWELGDFEESSVELFLGHIENLSYESKLPNGESKSEFFTRSIGAINKALNYHGENILIVAHGGVYWAILNKLGLPNELIGNAQIVYFQNDGANWDLMKL